MKKVILTVGASLILSACSTTSGFTNKAERELEEKVETSLNSSLARIEKNLAELDEIKRGKIKPVEVKANAPIQQTVARKVEDKPVLKVDSKQIDPKSSKGKAVVLSTLDQKINLNWQGDASDLVRSLSRKIGFEYKQTGTKTPLKVNVSAKNKTVKEVFGLIDSQTKSGADIKVSSSSKTIEFNYK